mgnify:CR=1 FL=1
MQDGGSLGIRLAELRIAIAGDLHGQWDAVDERLLEQLAPDALLVVGDLSDKTLEETSQLVVLRELAVFFDDYEQIHGIRSRRSGNVVYLEVFLEFRAELPFGTVQETMDRIRTRLETHIGNSRVLVVPSRSPPT